LTDSGIARRDDGGWSLSGVSENVTNLPANLKNGTFRTPFSRIGINRKNHLQLIAAIERRTVHLHSTDGGKTFSIALFPNGVRGHFEIETRNGHNSSAH